MTYGIQVEAGINVGAGITLGPRSPPPIILTFIYSQIIATQDQTPGAGGNGTGVVIINPTASLTTGPGIACSVTAGQLATIGGLTPVPTFPSLPYAPLQYTATWSAGSTYLTTPVEVGYSPNNLGVESWIFYVLNPSATAGQAGTFNFPVSFTAAPNTSISLF